MTSRLLFAVWLLASYLVTAIPMNHGGPAAPHDPSSGRELDDQDYQFLESLLPGLEASQIEPFHDKQYDAGELVSSLIIHPHPDQGIASSSASGSWRMRPQAKWWEPESFSRFQDVKPYGSTDKLHRLEFDHDVFLRHRINVEVFAGKLKWASPQGLADLTHSHYRSRWPVQQNSRLLPFVSGVGVGGSKVPVLMTSHDSSLSKSTVIDKALGGEAYGNKPYYFFWGVQDTPTARKVYSYGAGLILPADYEAVDKHLKPLLEAARSGA